jgi:acyl-coenzyme A thioesterase PaaI-like protein
MRVDYLRGAVDTDLTANARILRAGHSVGLVYVDVRDHADRAIATGRCVFSTRDN